ncbi:helix-turn-helix transcriptional regulator [Paenibacillus typhae]|uniref:AraC-type DNA-binding protein n=1 Tax=Paenibacillus typhae TaxID=1174501 RepID=A0A1G9AWH8_9BACL|nr:AraC family transcriptional regulator [Paenibacillus typhae]SDK31583.1 AraC-type DNA-binding protein [Paenibacillus typhae]
MKAFHENRMYPSHLPFSSWQVSNINFLAHWHTDLEFVYVREGSIRMGINLESRVLHKGDMAFCSSGDIHYYDSTGRESVIQLIIFNPQLIASPGGWPKDVRLTDPFICTGGQDQADIEATGRADIPRLMLQLEHELNNQLPHYEQIITGQLNELCGLLLRHLPCEPADQKKDMRRMSSRKVMQNVLDYLEDNYAEVITLEDAARQAEMSLFYFSRFFKSTTGMSYISYLNHIRVNKAEEMLLNSDKPIIDIALDCGFTNVRTFNRVFKQFRNNTPSSYR